MKYALAALGEIDALLRSAIRVLIASDFDGTLCPINVTPSAARVMPLTLEILERAIACPRISLAVISGRALTDVRARLPLDVVFAGNHGLEIGGGGLAFEHCCSRRLRPSMESARDALTVVLRGWPGAWVEDKGLSLTVHFRKVDRRDHDSLVFSVHQALKVFGAQFKLRAGHLALELLPGVSWDKGSALRHIAEQSGPFDLCVCIGDDRTDESMFRANRGHVNICVGWAETTVAGYYLDDSADVTVLLSHIVDVCHSPADIDKTLNRLASGRGMGAVGALEGH